ncbi:MAG: nitroreductase [Bacteroidota bacterium]
METPTAVSTLIRRRRSVFPPLYNDQPIPKEIIEEMLENANWAPTHRLTEPWRFKVMRGAALEKLSTFLGNYYKTHTPAEKFSEKKYEKTLKKPLRSACVIAICMQRDPEERVPEWEELAAVACAVQNMWLTATAYGIGAYWSSPKAIHEADQLFSLAEGERCLGFFFMGNTEQDQLPGRRQAIADKVQWLD